LTKFHSWWKFNVKVMTRIDSHLASLKRDRDDVATKFAIV
jgi:hypothetical protein